MGGRMVVLVVMKVTVLVLMGVLVLVVVVVMVVVRVVVVMVMKEFQQGRCLAMQHGERIPLLDSPLPTSAVDAGPP